MQIKRCTLCVKADAAREAGAVHLYPIWAVHCDDCCRRVLSFYPDHDLASMNMALIVGMKRGFTFVTSIQREIRDAGLQALAARDPADTRTIPLDIPDEDTAGLHSASSLGAGVGPDGFMRSYLGFRGSDAVRRFQQSASGRRAAK